MLFVQTGDGRPKFVCLCQPFAIGSGIVIGPEPGYRVSLEHSYKLSGADRWWLVECENAEAGRRVIESEGRACRCTKCGVEGDGDGQAFEMCAEETVIEVGRILASGGRTA
jgi:hypothetical protein